jgi:hypothetical protein
MSGPPLGRAEIMGRIENGQCTIIKYIQCSRTRLKAPPSSELLYRVMRSFTFSLFHCSYFCVVSLSLWPHQFVFPAGKLEIFQENTAHNSGCLRRIEKKRERERERERTRAVSASFSKSFWQHVVCVLGRSRDSPIL